jgi:FemAB-related protein (PEP-CTERM system-associated)
MSTESLEIRPGDCADDERRDRYVAAHPQGTFFHLSGWRRVIERVMGHRGADLCAWRGDELVGVFPLMRCVSLFGAPSLLSMPYAVYGGPLGDADEIQRALFDAAEREALEEKVGRLEMRFLHEPGEAFASAPLEASQLYYTFIRELPDTPEGVAAAMPKKARAEARKARKRHGLELSEGNWYIEDLVRMFHRNKHSLGSPALPMKLFQAFLEEFGDRVRVHLVRRGSQPLAAVMSFLFEDTLLAYYSGTAVGADREYSASNFMYMALQEWSVENGFRHFDFGRSRADAGAFKFKQHQGFTARPLPYRYRLVRDDHLPSLNPSNPKTRILQSVWSRMPLKLATGLSTTLSRYLP